MLLIVLYVFFIGGRSEGEGERLCVTNKQTTLLNCNQNKNKNIFILPITHMHTHTHTLALSFSQGPREYLLLHTHTHSVTWSSVLYYIVGVTIDGVDLYCMLSSFFPFLKMIYHSQILDSQFFLLVISLHHIGYVLLRYWMEKLIGCIMTLCWVLSSYHLLVNITGRNWMMLIKLESIHVKYLLMDKSVVWNQCHFMLLVSWNNVIIIISHWPPLSFTRYFTDHNTTSSICNIEQLLYVTVLFFSILY